MSDQQRLRNLAKTAWETVAEERQEQLPPNGGIVGEVLEWDSLTEDEKRVVEQPASWMLDAVRTSMSGYFQKHQREAFMEQATGTTDASEQA